MKTFITGGKIILSDTRIEQKTLVIANRKISEIIANLPKPSDSDKVVDAQGKWVSPGLIDIHVHGACGLDMMDCTTDAIHSLGHYYAAHGVTSYLPTTWSATPGLMMKAIDNIANCPQPEDGARHLGVHVEGPYLNVEYRGAQLKDLIRKPDPIEYKKWLDSGIVKLITIAPEIEGALEFIDLAVKQGVEFSIGHSGASYEQVIRAADHGVKQATHLFNGMLGLHHRNPGTAGAILIDDRIFAQIIADGVHVHPAMIKLAVRAKGVHRIILITDSIRGTGFPDGDYDYYGQKFTVTDGIARTPEGGLSGSTLTLDRALRNMIKFTGMSLSEVLPMATSVPAEAMGWGGQLGVLKPGADADVIMLNDDLIVEKVFVLGKEVFSK